LNEPPKLENKKKKGPLCGGSRGVPSFLWDDRRGQKPGPGKKKWVKRHRPAKGGGKPAPKKQLEKNKLGKSEGFQKKNLNCT